MRTDQTHISDDLKKIEELRQRDMQAVKEGDFTTLRSLLTEDAVMMPPDQPVIRGAEALENNYRKMEEAYKEIEILEYRMEFEDVKIVGNYAYEWGFIHGKSRTRDGKIEESSFKVMRILKKTESGEWKVHRAIWVR
jgi:ketosteroid isomerase-like protein